MATAVRVTEILTFIQTDWGSYRNKIKFYCVSCIISHFASLYCHCGDSGLSRLTDWPSQGHIYHRTDPVRVSHTEVSLIFASLKSEFYLWTSFIDFFLAFFGTFVDAIFAVHIRTLHKYLQIYIICMCT